MENTSSKNVTNVEASHSSNQPQRYHLSDPMPVEGYVTSYTFASGKKLFLREGSVAVFHGKPGAWGPMLKTGQVIVVRDVHRTITARVERFQEPYARKTSRYYRGPVKPIACSYVIMVETIVDEPSR